MAFYGLVGPYIPFRALYSQCNKSPATRELLLDCFDFDPQKWASVMVTGFNENLDWEEGVGDYFSMVELQIWFRAQVCFPNLYIIYY